MKNFFGFNVGAADEHGLPAADAKAFIADRTPPDVLEELAQTREKIVRADKKGSLPAWVTVLAWVFLIVAFCCIASIVGNIGELSLSEMYAKAAWVFYVGGASLSVFAAIMLFGWRRSRKAAADPSLEQINGEAGRALGRVKECLHIPPDAKEIDLFAKYYRIGKNGKIKNASTFFNYVNMSFYVYTRGENVCFSSLEFTMSVPRGAFVSYRRIDKNAMFTRWNKAENFNSPRYKAYKIRANSMGALFVKPYYSALLNTTEGEFEIIFPSYELDAMRSLIELPIVSA